LCCTTLLLPTSLPARYWQRSTSQARLFGSSALQVYLVSTGSFSPARSGHNASCWSTLQARALQLCKVLPADLPRQHGLFSPASMIQEDVTVKPTYVAHKTAGTRAKHDSSPPTAEHELSPPYVARAKHRHTLNLLSSSGNTTKNKYLNATTNTHHIPLLLPPKFLGHRLHLHGR
jgi:hypothetical protein